MPLRQYLDVEIAEKEIVEIELIEKELINVELNVIDILSYYEKTVTSDIVIETPTKITSKRFETSNSWVSGTLMVLFNGIKEKYITEINSTTFELPIDINTDDDIEVHYLKQA